jgi:alkylation response protein AidB-like acyl-CoA dehydrogenase
MDLNYAAEELAFRDEVRAWLAANLPTELRDKVLGYAELSREDIMRWHRILAAKGWIAPGWPLEWGGTGWNVVQRTIWDEETALAGAPPIPAFGITMCGQVLIKFGSEAQKRHFLPRIYQGEDFWCQGYSEPGSGSDLASLKTRAERFTAPEGRDCYRVNGQKIWTTQAQHADWIFCLVRTDPAAKKQEGISFLLIDMKTPGVTVRPLILLDGSHEVNEVFFDDVVVPAENLVFEENKGWTVAKFLLGHERLNTGRIGASKREMARLKKLAASTLGPDGRPMTEDPRFRDRLSRLEIELMALDVTNMGFVDQTRRTGQIGAEVSMLKIRGTEIQQGLTELMMQLAGPRAAAFRPIDHPDLDPFMAAFAARYFNFRKTTIYAGSSEVQRNIFAKQALGL